MDKLKTYRLPAMKGMVYLFIGFFSISLIILLIVNKKAGIGTSPILFGLIGGSAPILLQSRGKYRLLTEGLEQKHFLQKRKLIEYSRIYKIKRTKVYLPKKWLGGPALPYSLEVFYDKFDSLPVVVKDIEAFENDLKEKLGYATHDIQEEDVKKVIKKQEDTVVTELKELKSLFEFRNISLETLVENKIKNASTYTGRTNLILIFNIKHHKKSPKIQMHPYNKY
jgi:hypothetical protein